MSNGYTYPYYQQTDRHQASQPPQALTQGSTSASFPSQREPSSSRPQSLTASEAFERSQYASARSMKNTLPEYRRDWYNNSQNESASSDVGGSLGLSGNQERVTSRPPDGRTYDTSALGNLAYASGLDFNGTSTHLGQSRPAPSTSQYALSDSNLQNSEPLSQDQGGASSKRYWPSRMDTANSVVSSMVSNYNQPPSAPLVSNARHSSPYTEERAHSRHQSSSSGGTYKRGGQPSASASSTYNHHQYGAHTTLAHENLEVGRSNVRTPTINTPNHRRPSAQGYSQPVNFDSPALQDPHTSKSEMRFAFHTDPGASGLSQGAQQVQQHSPEPLTTQRTPSNNIQSQQSSALGHLEPQNSSRPIQRIATPTYYSQQHHAQRTSSPLQSGTTQRDGQQPNPVTVDPSQVYNPYHEYERQVQAGQALAARRIVEQAAGIPERAQEINQTQASTAPLPQDQPAEEASSKTTKKNGKSRPLRQSKSMKKQGTSSTNNEVQTATAEIKAFDAPIVQHESDLATMEAEMKEMVEKMRKYSTQNPEMFSQVWRQVKLTGSQNTIPQPPLPKPMVSGQPPIQSPVQQTTPSIESRRKRKRSNKTQDEQHQSNLQRPQPESGQLNAVNATSETRPDMLQITQADESQSQSLTIAGPVVGSQARTGPVRNVQGETKTVQVTSRPDVKIESLATAALVHLRFMDENTEKMMDKEKFLGLLASNPTYVGLCEALERLGLLFDRGKLARALLIAVPDANSTARQISQEIHSTPPQAPPRLHENQAIVIASTETNHPTQSMNTVTASSNRPLPNSGQKRVVGRRYKAGTPAALEAEAGDASADGVRVSPTTQPPDHDAKSASKEPQPKVPAVPQVQRLQNSLGAPANTIPASSQTPPLFTQQSRETIARFIPPRPFPPPPPYYFPANGIPPFNQSASKLGINSHHPHSQVPHATIGSPFADGAKISLNHNGDLPATANPSFTHTNSPIVSKPLLPPSQYQSLPVHQHLSSHKRRISEVVDLTDGQPGYYKVARHDSPHFELGARHANLHSSRSMTPIQLPFAGTPISAPDAWSKLHPLRNADLVSVINRKRALRRSTYNPRFIARDILLASGRHPDVGALNQHLELLKKNFSCINNDSELTTFRWDFVDPGGVPVGSRTSSNANTKPNSASFNATLGTQPSPNHRISTRTVPDDPSDGDIEEIPASEFRTTTNAAKKVVDRDTERGKLDKSRSSLGNPNNKVKANHPVRSVETEPDQESSNSPLRKRYSHRGTSSDKAVSKSTMIPARGGSNRSKSVSSMPLRPSGLRHSVSSSLNFEGKFAVVVESSPPISTTSSNKRHSKVVKMANQRRQPSDIFMQAPNATFKEYRCGWRECKATLHNVNTLRKHVEKKHGNPTDGTLTCFWKDCDTEEMIVEDEVSGCDRIVSGPKTFASRKAWEDHVEKMHVTPYLWELGDGPVSEPYDGHASNLSGHLTDDQGRRLTPIAKPLPKKRKPGLAPGEDEESVSSSLLPEKDISNKRLRIALEHFHEVQKRRRTDGLEGPDMGPFIERGGCRLAKDEFRQIFDIKKGYSEIVEIDSDPEV